jgi:methyl-accepting chemotaxis protein
MAAMWLQGASDFSLGNDKLLMIFIGLVAAAMVAQAIVLIVVSVKSMTILRGLTETVDELKMKSMPLLRSATELSDIAQSLVRETAPKVKTIGDNLLEASDAVRGSARQLESTLNDVNRRTQRQVARVDGMVTSVLGVTAELAETIDNGIRGPAQKLAAVITQARLTFESLFERARWMAAGIAGGKRRD